MDFLQSTDPKYILAGILGIVVLFIIVNLIKAPIKIIIKLIANGVVGVILLYVVNLIGANFGIQIGINFVTALISGILGIPGVIALILIQLFI